MNKVVEIKKEYVNNVKEKLDKMLKEIKSCFKEKYKKINNKNSLMEIVKKINDFDDGVKGIKKELLATNSKEILSNYRKDKEIIIEKINSNIIT